LTVVVKCDWPVGHMIYTAEIINNRKRVSSNYVRVHD